MILIRMHNTHRYSLSVLFLSVVIIVVAGVVFVANAFRAVTTYHRQHHNHQHSHPLTTNRIATTSSSSFGGGRNVKEQQQQQQPWTKHWHGKKSALQMGVMEDFLTGQDQGKRIQANKEYLASLQVRVDAINALESTVEELDDDELRGKTVEFQQRIKAGGEDIDGPILEEAFAVVREAAWRVLELRHYDVQIMGGMILHDGRLAEMATGEGKTLVSTLPVYLNALTGKTSFVVTVNDYLARRDMEKMGQVHNFLGLSVGLIQANMKEEQRRIAYAKDVVYVTNSELGFDYLRDHLALSQQQTVLLQQQSREGEREAGTGGDNKSSAFLEGCFCVVDEADSVLIDEARTPLIISQQVPAPANKYGTANQLANALKKDVHYKVDLKNKNIVMTDTGFRDCEKALGVDTLFTLVTGEAWAPFVMNAIKAKELFTKDIEYTVLKDSTGKATGVGIIDAFTGRVLDGRRWSDGLHQSIEAMEGIAVSQQSKVIAKITYQALFRQLFSNRLSGMTGTAMADAGELESVYGLTVTPVPTALPIARRDYPDVAFKTRKAANDALIKEIINVGGGQEGGRPCLVGTTSVAQSEILVEALIAKGIKGELLNASPKNAPRESEIVAQAGRCGVVTVATNMAGRGTDILLGGCPTTMSRIKTRSVLLENGVITDTSDQAAKVFPPSPPEDYFPCDLDDETYKMLSEAASALKEKSAKDKKPMTELELDEILTVAFDTTETEDDTDYIVQLRNAAVAVKETYAPVLAEEKEIVQSAGGLYVMGTNRHESSRIDQQLRGRAGRQGDPGTSRFFLSFEDDMFVIFGGDKLQSLLTNFRVSEDMAIESPQITKALDKVQQQVEEKYRSIRTEIFRFDEVLNSQRNVVYARRNDILFSTPAESLELMKSYNKETIREIVEAQSAKDGSVNVGKILEKIGQFFPLASPVIRDDDLVGKDTDTVTAFVTIAVDEVFKEKTNDLEQRAKASDSPPNSLGRTANYISLLTMDNAWSDHLQSMENLKEAVVLRSYQGRDPVSEYQNEAFGMFKGLEDTMRRNAVFSLWQSLVQTTSKQPAATQSA